MKTQLFKIYLNSIMWLFAGTIPFFLLLLALGEDDYKSMAISSIPGAFWAVIGARKTKLSLLQSGRGEISDAVVDKIGNLIGFAYIVLMFVIAIFFKSK